MKKKELCIFVILLLVFFALFFVAQLRVIDSRADFSYRLQVSAAPIPPMLLKALGGEFKGLLANYFFLEAATFVGGNTAVSDKEWAAVARLLEQSSVLDPYFKQTYSFAQGVLPWHAGRVDQTMVILERSREHRTWDWLPGFFMGFNHFYFNQDHAAASQALMAASRVQDAPPALATWAARLASQAGQNQTALEFLEGVYSDTADEQQKDMIKKRIIAVQGAYTLQQAVDRFSDQYDRYPISLDELIEWDILVELPLNPYPRPFVLNEEGIVEF
jgi:hypothetical protein